MKGFIYPPNRRNGRFVRWHDFQRYDETLTPCSGPERLTLLNSFPELEALLDQNVSTRLEVETVNYSPYQDYSPVLEKEFGYLLSVSAEKQKETDTTRPFLLLQPSYNNKGLLSLPLCRRTDLQKYFRMVDSLKMKLESIGKSLEVELLQEIAEGILIPQALK